MAIYTKKGDKGKTSVYNDTPKKISKNSDLINTIGAIDEVNSYIGIITSETKFKKRFLEDIQGNLFTINAILAGANLKLDYKEVKKLEKLIDELEGKLPVLKEFILPGGSSTASKLMYLRALVRKAERKLVGVDINKEIKAIPLKYINRLSDTVFMLARYANHKKGIKIKKWKK